MISKVIGLQEDLGMLLAASITTLLSRWTGTFPRAADVGSAGNERTATTTFRQLATVEDGLESSRLSCERGPLSVFRCLGVHIRLSRTVHPPSRD
jgi:hypothetical protein